ncbi:MAG: PQQ-binding-like beta-propeller repeat protein, partial [Acidobacteria bacterium]|nr:PQQ-binding-like beta-propeller repeat protein [Acidobacteriota bacterium]
ISLAEGTNSNDHVAWSSPRDGPYMASPLVYQGYLYVVATNGVLTVFDAATGERAYRRRIGQRGGAYTASPIAADGRVYLTSEDGDVFVIRAGPEYEELAMNSMDEVCLATPAISEGQLIIRTTNHLVALRDGIAPTMAASKPSSTPFPEDLAADQVVAFDDFEDGDLFAHTGVRWHTFTNGVSSADLSLIAGGAAATPAAARVDGTLASGAARGPLAQMYQPFDRGGNPISLENLGGIRFHARGSHAFELTFRCSGVGFGKRVEVADDWRLVELGADDLKPVEVPEGAALWDGARCTGLYLSRRGEAELGEFWFEVDEFTLYGEDAWESRPR